MRVTHESSIEILDGSFSEQQQIAESFKGRAHSTPNHVVQIVSGNLFQYTVVATLPEVVI